MLTISSPGLSSYPTTLQLLLSLVPRNNSGHSPASSSPSYQNASSRETRGKRRIASNVLTHDLKRKILALTCEFLPGMLRRVVPAEGRVIAGKWVKGGTVVAVDIMSANFSSTNFALADQFCPERWLSFVNHPTFKRDNLSAVQPVSPSTITTNLEFRKLTQSSSPSDHATVLASASP